MNIKKTNLMFMRHEFKANNSDCRYQTIRHRKCLTLDHILVSYGPMVGAAEHLKKIPYRH